MIKVMIADDEELIREGLKTSVAWSDHDMQVVAVAESGEEGIAMAKEFQPDLVITDICMPFGNGLDMARDILEWKPDTTLLVLTCYEDFDYAKTALQIGVFDYLIKPVDLNELDELLEKIRKKHEKQKEERADISQILSNAVHGKKCTDEVALGIKEEYYCCVIFRLLNFEYVSGAFSPQGVQEHLSGFQTMVEECGPKAVLKEEHLDSGYILLVFSGATQQDAEGKIQAAWIMFLESAKLQEDYPALCAISRVEKSIGALREIYKQCKDIASVAYLYDDTIRITYDDFLESEGGNSDLSANLEAFSTCMRSFDKHAVGSVLQEIVSNLQRGGHDSAIYCRLFVASVFVELLRIAKEMGVDTNRILGSTSECYHEIITQGSLNYQIQKVREYVDNLCDYVHETSQKPHSEEMRRALQFIEEHYEDSGLTLQSVAQAVHMSPSYFSIVFRQCIGKSFIAYLTDFRIEKSKYLLRSTSQKIYEVGYSVGYDNPTYFSTLFKKCCGMGPSEYRLQRGLDDKIEKK